MYRELEVVEEGEIVLVEKGLMVTSTTLAVAHRVAKTLEVVGKSVLVRLVELHRLGVFEAQRVEEAVGVAEKH